MLIVVIADVVTYLAGLGKGTPDADELRKTSADLRALRAAVDAAEARVAAAIRAGSATRSDTLEALRAATGCSKATARRYARRAETLEVMPSAASLLADGKLTAEHVDLLAGAARLTSAQEVDTDTELLAKLAASNADEASHHLRRWTEGRHSRTDSEQRLRRQRERRFLTFKNDPDDGMVKAFSVMDNVSGSQMRALLGDIATKLRDHDNRAAYRRGPHGRRRGSRAWGHYMMEALLVATGVESAPPAVAATLRAGSSGDEPSSPAPQSHRSDEIGPRPSLDTAEPPSTQRASSVNASAASTSAGGWCRCAIGRRHEILVMARTDVISGDDMSAGGELAGGGSIPRSELERLACDSELIGALFTGYGEPLWHGRSARRVTDAQWRMLVGRDRGCVLCHAAPMYCQAHHILPWLLNGPTDITNLALVCGLHHSYVHANHLSLVRDGDSGTWHTRPDPRMAAGARPRRAPPAADSS